MENVRKKIISIDTKIIEMLGKRMKLAEEIGKIKKASGIPIWDLDREKELRAMHTAEGKKLGLSAEFTEKLFDAIFEESRRIQDR